MQVTFQACFIEFYIVFSDKLFASIVDDVRTTDSHASFFLFSVIKVKILRLMHTNIKLEFCFLRWNKIFESFHKCHARRVTVCIIRELLVCVM